MFWLVSWLFNLCYAVVLLASAPWLAWSAWKHGKYRQGWASKLFGSVPQRPLATHDGTDGSDHPCIWLHAVSLGEVNVLAPLLARIERDRPDCQCVISTTTRTGYEQAVKRYPKHQVIYCPFDFTWAVRRAMNRIRPDLLVLAELELWPNLIGLARKRGVAVAVVNGRLSQKSYRGYARLRWLVRAVLRKLDFVAVQNEEYAERFASLGVHPKQLHVTGSLKFDGAKTDRANPQTRQLAALAGFTAGDIVFLAGSTQHPEEALAIETFRALAERHPRLKLAIVPRHPERFAEVNELLAASGITYARRSQLSQSSPANRNTRVLLVDAVGELAAWWGTAAIGFVGGSLDGKRGGQSMIEPAGYGTAICFGPHTRNFRDVVAIMLASDAAKVVASGGELTSFVARCLESPDYAAELGENARDLVLRQQGAADRTWQLLAPLLPEATDGEPPVIVPFPRKAAG